MKKLAIYLIYLMSTTGACAAALIALEKDISELTTQERQAIVAVIEGSGLKDADKTTFSFLANGHIGYPNGDNKVSRLFFNLMSTLELQRETLCSEATYRSLLKDYGNGRYNITQEPFMLKGTTHGTTLFRHYKNEAQFIDALGKLVLQEVSKPSMTEFKSEQPFILLYVPGETFSFHAGPLTSDQLLRVIALDENNACIRPKWYILHRNGSVETQNNSLILNRKSAILDEAGKRYDDPNGHYYLLSGNEHTPLGMLPHSLKFIAHINALECTKDEAEKQLNLVNVNKIRKSELSEIFAQLGLSDQLAKGNLELRAILLNKLSKFLISEDPLPAELSALENILDLSSLRKFAHHCKTDNERYIFVKSLFKPLAEESPAAKTLILALPSNPLENCLLYLTCLEKQKELLGADETELAEDIDSEITLIEEHALQLISESDWGNTTRAELEKQWEARKAAVASGNIKGKNAKKKAAKAAQQQSPEEIEAKNMLLKQQEQQTAFKEAVRQEFKRLKERFNDKFKPLIKSVQSICQTHNLSFQQEFGKGDHLKLKFDSGAVVLPTHDRGKGLCHKILRQLENILSESFYATRD